LHLFGCLLMKHFSCFDYHSGYFVFEVMDEVMQFWKGLVGWLHFHRMVIVAMEVGSKVHLV